jgi:prepilin-type N-terminal cleavage/methylation domain-containing protein
LRFYKKTLSIMKKYDNKGFSMIEVIVVIALAGFALIALSSLFLGTNLTKTTNENLLLASNLASDVMEHIKKVSINNYESLQELLKYDDTKTIDFKDIFNETNPMTELYDDSPPASLNSLPDSINLSYVYFEVLERNLSNPLIVNKILTKIVIKWKEIAREQNNEREYSIATYIFKNGLGNFLK